jgi:Ca-activated chloride channel family protein
MRKLISSLWLLPFTSLLVLGQDAPKTAPAPAELRRGPVLVARDGAEAEKALSIARADVHVLVDGALAQTTLTLTFANDANRVLEGELMFPLPEGSTVSGYGLDVNGQMVDGVAVEKEHARQSYEQEVHKGIDPGLLEHVAGNNFRTRVYPIPAKGTRIVRVQYEGDLTATADGLGFSVPLNWGQKIAACTVRVEVLDASAKPILRGHAFEAMAFGPRDGGGLVAEGKLNDVMLAEDLSVGVTGAGPAVAVEKRAKEWTRIEDLAGAKRGDAAQTFEYFFAIGDRPAVPAARAVVKPKRIGVLWDASMSREGADKAREIALLKGVLDGAGAPGVDVVLFRNIAEPPVAFEVGDAAGLVKFLERVKYDGATNLGDLKFGLNHADLPGGISRHNYDTYDYWLLFSDGLGDVGKPLPAKAKTPVYAVSNDDRANHAVLRQIAEQSGGAYLNLKRLTDEQAAGLVGKPPYSLLKVECKESEVADVTPAGSQQVSGRVTVSGKLLVPEAKVTLHYGYGQIVMASQSFTLKQADARAGGLVPRVWAQQRVAELAVMPEENHDQLLGLGREFNLATPATSLLVLETADQYVQHRVVPPKNRPEVYAQFMEKIEQNKVAEQKTHEQRVQSVLAMWDERVKWWEAKYEYPAKFVYAAPAGNGGAETGPAAALRAGAAAPSTQPGQAVNLAVNGRNFGDAPDSSLNIAGRPGQPPAPRDAPPARRGGGAVGAEDRPLAEARAEMDALRRPVPPTGMRSIVQGQSEPAGQQAAERGQVSDEHLANRDVSRYQRRVANPEPAASVPGSLGRDAYAIRQRSNLSSAEEVEKKLDDGTGANVAVIGIKQWDPQTPYLQAMKAAGPSEAYDVFLAQRKTFGTSPAFYLDCADYLLRNNQREMGIRVLSDVAELQLEDARLLRIVAHKFQQIGEREAAIDLFEKALHLRPEEPQSQRDLALALAEKADAGVVLTLGKSVPPVTMEMAVADYTRSLALLNEVIMGSWQRFDGIQVVALMEYNRILATLKGLPGAHEISNPLDARLVKLLDCDVRIVMTWDTDNTDMDLWVTEPSGEKCFYQHNRTTIGGLLSKDFTDGYGPEEYCLRKQMPGQYKIQANFYGSRQQSIVGPTTVQATVITNFGRPDEKRQSLTLRLTENKEVVDIGTITMGQAEAQKKN